MAEYSEAIFTDKATKHVALLQYISGQLRCYADELSAKDGVLPAFADMLDDLAGELNTAKTSNGAAAKIPQIAIQ